MRYRIKINNIIYRSCIEDFFTAFQLVINYIEFKFKGEQVIDLTGSNYSIKVKDTIITIEEYFE